MMEFTVFDAETGLSLRTFTATTLDNVAIQSNAAHEVILEGNWPAGEFELGIDGQTQTLGDPKPVAPVEPTVDPAQVKEFTARVLRDSGWRVERHRDQTDMGEPTSLTDAQYRALLAYRSEVRQASNAIEAMSPIPADFQDPKYWP